MKFNFRTLMKEHILSARKVVAGKISGNKSLVNAGLAGLKSNTEKWGQAIGNLTTEAEGKRFAVIWGEHVALEGDYIGAMFGCKCHSVDFGRCEKAKAGKTALNKLYRNGVKLVGFLTRKFGNERVWQRNWENHLQCVKDFIDIGAQVKCGTRSRRDFDGSIHHCVMLGDIFGSALNEAQNEVFKMRRR